MIHLGDKEWRVRPLTLAQVQEIEPILMASSGEAPGTIAAAVAIVSIALARDHADAAKTLGEIEATTSEIAAAMATVLRLGGFIEHSEEVRASSGEERAGVARISVSSMPA
jgi:hypothetical protein